MNLVTLCITVDADAEPYAVGDLLQTLQYANMRFVSREREADFHEHAEYVSVYDEE